MDGKCGCILVFEFVSSISIHSNILYMFITIRGIWACRGIFVIGLSTEGTSQIRSSSPPSSSAEFKGFRRLRLSLIISMS